MIMNRKLWTLVLIAGMFAGIAGCCGGDTTVREQPIIVPTQSGSGATLGEELQALEDTYKKGIITKDEYETAKKKLLDSAGK